jgi:hypothetical protein
MGASKKGKGAATRPPLRRDTPLAEFRNHYWYLGELAAFCRAEGLPASGSKLELVQRIEKYLTTGKREAPARKPAKAARATTRSGPITLKTVVTDDYKCDAETRAFFQSVIGDHFHFTAHLQQFRREKQRKGERLTYGDLVREWLADQERRKDKNYKSNIERTWQWNQFVRDYMGDRGRSAGKRIADAAKAWNQVREHRGPHTYAEYLRLTEER